MTRRLLPLVLLAALVLPQSAEADHGKRHTLRWRTMHAAERLCTNKRPTACITYAAVKYRQPVGAAIRVARCESTLRPWISGHHQGLYQFLWSTWRTTPYRRYSPYSARWSSLAAMWMWSQGRRGEWACR